MRWCSSFSKLKRMGPVASCIFMNFFEEAVLNQALHSDVKCPSMWLRYVDDVLLFWPHDVNDFDTFYALLNDFRPSIRFNLEKEEHQRIAFLDVSIRRTEDALEFRVYRKATHTDLYVQRASAHPAGVFRGVVRTLAARAKRICSHSELESELSHLSRVFQLNGYTKREVSRGLRANPVLPRETKKKRHSIPYVRGASERIGAILREVGIETAMRPVRTLRSLLVRKRPVKPKMLGSVYLLKCSDCHWKYVGETGREVEERRKEHRRAWRELDVSRSEVARHAAETGHRIDFEGLEVVEREANWRRRVVKEAMWTKKANSSNKVKHDIGNLWQL